MKYLTEFRNGEIAQRMAREIAAAATRPWKIMEVCGGQTHSIIKNGIDQMLPAGALSWSGFSRSRQRSSQRSLCRLRPRSSDGNR